MNNSFCGRLRERGTLVLLTLICCLGTASADAIHYAGSLSSLDGGLQGTGFWPAEGTTLSWVVDENPNGSWTYSYTLIVPRADVSHFILEVSDSFTVADMFNVSGPFASYVVATHPGFPGSGTQPNPFMPDDTYGIKFDSTYGTTVTFTFTSLRMPVWADFYAKCGNVGGTQNTIWNAGFTTSDDNDPTAPPSSGSLGYHILAPDSVGDPRVPEPATLSLLALGLPALRLLRRRRG